MAAKALALGDFNGVSAQNQTSFKQGDSVTILNKIPGGWWYGVCDSTGEKGYFPETFVKEYDPAAVGAAPKSPGRSKWKSSVDQRYNRTFYVNSETGETTWTKPVDFDGEDEAAGSLGESPVDEAQEDSVSEEESLDEDMEVDEEDVQTVSQKQETIRRSALFRENAGLYSSGQKADSLGSFPISASEVPAHSQAQLEQSRSNAVKDGGEGGGVKFSAKDIAAIKSLQKSTSTFKTVSRMPSGYLVRKKQKNSFFSSSFHRQYFVLNVDTKKLYYADKEFVFSASLSSSKKCIDMEKVTNVWVTQQKDVDCTIGLQIGKNTALIVSADSEEDFTRWLAALRVASTSDETAFKRPESEEMLNEWYGVLLQELALPDAAQKDMMANQSADQKWQLLKLNRAAMEKRIAESHVHKANKRGSHFVIGSISNAQFWAKEAVAGKIADIEAMRKLQPAVATSGREWLDAFATAGGLDGLIATLRSLAEVRLSTKENLELRLVGMSIMKAFMNNQTGMDALVEASGGIQMIVQQICPNVDTNDGNLMELSDKITEAALEKLSVLCWYLGYSDTVMEAFDEFRRYRFEHVRFQTVIDRLYMTKSSTLRLAIMMFINSVINSTCELEDRVIVRSCFLQLRLDEIMIHVGTELEELAVSTQGESKGVDDSSIDQLNSFCKQMDVFDAILQQDLEDTMHESIDTSSTSSMAIGVAENAIDLGMSDALLPILQSLYLVPPQERRGKATLAAISDAVSKIVNAANEQLLSSTLKKKDFKLGSAWKFNYESFLKLLETHEADASAEKKKIAQLRRLNELEEDLKDALAREDGMKTRIDNMFNKLAETNKEKERLDDELKNVITESDAKTESLEAEVRALKTEIKRLESAPRAAATGLATGSPAGRGLPLPAAAGGRPLRGPPPMPGGAGAGAQPLRGPPPMPGNARAGGRPLRGPPPMPGAQGLRGPPPLSGGARPTGRPLRGPPPMPGARGARPLRGPPPMPGARGARGGPQRGPPPLPGARGGVRGPPPMPGRGPPPMPGARGGLGMPRAAQAVSLPPKPKITPNEKMKSLFWKKLKDKSVVDSFWKDVDESIIKLDTSKLEELFSKAKLQAKAPKSNSKGTKSKGSISFVDPRRQQNVGIGLSRFGQKGLSPRDIKRAIQQIDDRVLSLDILTSLEKLLPTPDERDAIKSFEGDKSRLANVEKFFVEILEVKDVVQRVKAMKEKASFDDLLKECKLKLSTFGSAIREVKTSPSFRQFLTVVLATGNYLNGGNKKGQAYGFHLETLIKLNALKTKDNKSTLLRYIIRFMDSSRGNSNSPKKIEDEMKHVVSASKQSLSEVKGAVNRLKASTNLMKSCSERAEPSDAIRDVMGPFLESYANPSVERLTKQIAEVETDAKNLILHYGETGLSVEDVLESVAKFMGQLQAAYEENKKEKILSKKRADRENRSALKSQTAKSGEGLFAAFSKDQEGNAKEIVERVRTRQARQSVMVTNRPPAPPKPPSSMQLRFSGGRINSGSLGGIAEE